MEKSLDTRNRCKQITPRHWSKIKLDSPVKTTKCSANTGQQHLCYFSKLKVTPLGYLVFDFATNGQVGHSTSRGLGQDFVFLLAPASLPVRTARPQLTEAAPERTEGPRALPPRHGHLPHLPPLPPGAGRGPISLPESPRISIPRRQGQSPSSRPVLAISSKAAPPAKPLLASVTEDASSGHEAGQAASENREVRAGQRFYPAACLLKFSGWGDPPNKGKSEGRQGSSDGNSNAQGTPTPRRALRAPLRPRSPVR